MHAHEHLSVARFGIGPGLDDELLVGDTSARTKTRRHRSSSTGELRYLAGVAAPALAFLDDEGEEVLLDADEAARAPRAHRQSRRRDRLGVPDLSEQDRRGGRAGRRAGGRAATSRAARSSSSSPTTLPTLHLYVRDLTSRCAHDAWRDPGFDEWNEAIDDLVES